MDHETASDARLFEAVQRSEPGAFEQFVDRYGPIIRSFGRRQCGPNADADDVYQETLLRVFQGLSQLRDPSAIRSWLFRVVANQCLMTRRRNPPSREVQIEELSDREWLDVQLDRSPAWQGLPREAAERAEFRQQLSQSAQGLSPDERIVFLLRDVEGLSTLETAEALEIGESAVKMRLSRARQHLRQALQQWLS
jgi:RNA polymerase sigma-70 factor (ECF subfamily)